MSTVTRVALILRGMHVGIAGVIGATPSGAGYRLDFGDGTSRAATQAEIDAATAWADARIAESAADDTDAGAVRGDNSIRNLMLMSPAQIEAWATSNVTTLAQARAAIIVCLKVASMLARRLLR